LSVTLVQGTWQSIESMKWNPERREWT
jgi:hypothetical protein